MPYRFTSEETVAVGAVRIAREQIDRACRSLRENEDPHEAVHDTRKRFKKIRGLLRLLHGSLGEVYSRENAWFRDAGRELAGIRDAQAMLEALDKLREHFPDLPPQAFLEERVGLTVQRIRATQEVENLPQRLEELAARLEEARQRVEQWPIECHGFDALADGLKRSYKRGRDAFERAYSQPCAASFHEWRKRVKYHWYHHRLLENIWKDVMFARKQELKKLSDHLGDDHDLSVLIETMQEHGEELGPPEELTELRKLIGTRQQELRSRAYYLGRRIYAEKPKRLAGRFEAYWQAWRASQCILADGVQPQIAMTEQ